MRLFLEVETRHNNVVGIEYAEEAPAPTQSTKYIEVEKDADRVIYFFKELLKTPDTFTGIINNPIALGNFKLPLSVFERHIKK